MLEAGLSQAGIAFPAVGVDVGARHHGLAHEGEQAPGRHVRDPAQADAADALAILLCGDGDDRLALDLAAPFALFRAPHIGFVDLDRAAQAVASRPRHGPTQLVQPAPRGLVFPAFFLRSL